MNTEHTAHCRACKERVRELLTAIYGDCRVNHAFLWSSRPEDYSSTPIKNLLLQIRTALGDWRGHRDFIKSAQMPPCDYFVADPPFIVEFDENQHFSRSRLVTLANYPANCAIGFSILRWQQLCGEINAVDDTPIDRDERRAWYDTLRDLLPTTQGFKPTVRIYAEVVQRCALNAASPADLAIFGQLIGEER